MEKYLENYNRWLNCSALDEETHAELLAIQNDETEKKLRFSSYMSFGTAGLRSVMRAGTNGMNIYTVMHATKGLANFINKQGEGSRGVAIAYDSRNNSALFAKKSACVLAANNIKVYLFESLRPTPVLSFAIRELNCIAGINITASHNPKEYNGYKTYWEDGAQLSLEQADEVSAAISETDIFDGVNAADYEKSLAENKIKILSEDFDERYIAAVTAQQVNKAVFTLPSAKDFKVVYTPLHGTGYRLVPEVLRRIGIKSENIYTVGEQMVPDGNFPGIAFPNPEFPEVFEKGRAIAKKIGSDLIIATDPDADRVGIMVINADKKFVTLTGNQVGALLADYIVSAYERTNTMPSEPYIVKTIVSTELVSAFCRDHNIKLYNVLTGFKFIGEVIKKHKESGHGSFLLGFEESYGYLKGAYARDKDAVVATMLICEMAAYYRTLGISLLDALENLYKRYGYYRDGVHNIFVSGLDGADKIKNMLDSMRKEPPKTLAGEKIVSIRDYESKEIKNLVTGETSDTGLPVSNVLYFETENRNVAIIRPSGTEPKVKFYFLVHGKTAEEADTLVDSFKKDIIPKNGI